MSYTNERLSGADSRVLRAVCDLPLASAGDIAEHLGLAFSTVFRRLVNLEGRGLVASALSGAAFRSARRYWLLPDGARWFLEPEIQFHVARRLNALACFMPGVEWFYRVAARLPQLSDVGNMQSFHWRFRDGVDAMVHYAAGTVAFIWSGPWQTVVRLRERLDELGRAAPVFGGWPALVCVVAADFWQAYRVSEVLSEYGVGDGALVFCAETGMVTGGGRAAPGNRQLLLAPILGARSRVVRAGKLRMLSGVRAGMDAYLCYRIMYLVEQFPGATAGALVRALGSRAEHVSGKLLRLVEQGLLLDIEGHHYLSDDSLIVSGHRDRVHSSRPRRRFGSRGGGGPAAVRHRWHDAAAFAVVSVFRDQGFPVAGGWRGDDYAGGRDAIAPDAMIYVGEGSSGGAGWRYLEYERRADSAQGVSSKLRGYLSRELPLLVVARNPTTSDQFRREAAVHGLMLWSVPMGDIKVQDRGTICGPETVWLDHRGSAASFFPPSSERIL